MINAKRGTAQNIRLLLTLGLLAAAQAATADTSQVSCLFTPQLTCSDVRSGDELWSNTLYSDPKEFVLAGSRLYISQSTNSASYDLRSGTTAWRVSSNNDARYFYPVVDGESVYLARSDGIMEKRQADSGQLIWSRSLGKGWVYPPVIQHNHLVTGGSDRTLWVLDESTGQMQDSLRLNQEVVAPLFQAGERFVASTFNGKLSAFELNQKTGKIEAAWQAKLDAPAFSYIPGNQNLVTEDMGGQLSSIDPATGKIRWQQIVHQNARYWSVRYAHKIISLTNTGTLTILDADSGALQNQLQFTHQYTQAPIVRGDHITLYDRNGDAQLLDSKVLQARPITASLTSN